LGISGVSGDMRDLRQAAAAGHVDAQLALDFFAAEVRRLMGGLLIELGPPDAVVFTGGIGQNDWQLRQEITQGLDWLGMRVSEARNPQVRTEGRIDDGQGCQIWVVPTNEELVVARQVKALLESQ
jgi:acetate kinase